MISLSLSILSTLLPLTWDAAVDPSPDAVSSVFPAILAQANQEPPPASKQSPSTVHGGRRAGTEPAGDRSSNVGRQTRTAALPDSAQIPDSRILVFPIKYASLSTVSRIINQQFGEVTTPDDRTQSLIFVGPEDLVGHVEHFISTLDNPATRTAEEGRLEIIQIVNRDPRDIVVQLSQTSLRNSLNFSADSARSMILLDGTAAENDRVKKVIAGLDQPLVSCEVEFVFFLGSAKAAGPSREKLDTPEDLRAVADELTRFGSIEYLARMATVVTQDKAFELSGGVGKRADILINGKMETGTPTGPMTFSIISELRLIDAEGKPGPRFMLRTTLTSNRDEFLVLGSAPSGWDPGESVILAVRIPSSNKD
mgnify:CR=1 FL=1